MAWSDKYIGLPFKHGGMDIKTGTDCRTLMAIILRDEFNYDAKISDDIPQDWFEKDPDLMLREGIKRGEVIKNIKDLRERDIIFFADPEGVKHMGIMSDPYGNFLHQLIKFTSRLEKLRGKWAKVFHCGIRIHEIR